MSFKVAVFALRMTVFLIVVWRASYSEAPRFQVKMSLAVFR